MDTMQTRNWWVISFDVQKRTQNNFDLLSFDTPQSGTSNVFAARGRFEWNENMSATITSVLQNRGENCFQIKSVTKIHNKRKYTSVWYRVVLIASLDWVIAEMQIEKTDTSLVVSSEVFYNRSSRLGTTSRIIVSAITIPKVYLFYWVSRGWGFWIPGHHRTMGQL